LGRFTSIPRLDYWKAINRVFKYLKYTLNYELHYTGYPIIHKWYNDTNWISDINDSKFISWYVFTFSGAIVLWEFYKQIYIARSIMESKFIAFDKVGEEVESLYNFLEDISC
jgi:hypothetical protein